MDLLKFIFIIFLGIFSLGEIIRFNLINNLSIKPIDIIVVILVIVWLMKIRIWKKSINFKNSLFPPVVLFVSVISLSLIVNINNFSSNEIFVAFSYILRWVLYAMLYLVVGSLSPKFKKWAIYLLSIFGMLIVLLGFAQYFFYSNLRNLYYLGWDEHMHRLFSTFLDPNFAGAFLVLFLIFLSGIFLYKRTWIIGISSFLTLIAIFLTFSRSALIMLFVSSIIFSILTKKIKYFLGLTLISIIFIFIASRNFDIENINLLRIVSSEARIDSAKAAVQIIENNPIFGIGFNTYRYAQVKYGFRSIANSSHADAGTDNSFLFVLATTGIVGLIFYINLLWNMLKKSYLIYKGNTGIQKYLGIITFTSIGGIIINSFFINSLFYSFIMIWIWILLGLMERD